MNCEDCGSINAEYVLDPFCLDVNNTEWWRWLCGECESNRTQEI